MAKNAFFYRSDNGDRIYTADSFSDWLKKFFTTGVFTGDLQVKALKGMQVQVGEGYCNIGGKVKIYDVKENLDIEVANSSFPRIDTVVIERNDLERDFFLKVVKGDYAENNPTPKAPLRTDNIYQIVLAEILVGGGATEIKQENITDKRANKDVCGIVTSTVEEMDFTQFQAQFDDYYKNFKELSVKSFNDWSEEVKEEQRTFTQEERRKWNAWLGESKNQYDVWIDQAEDDWVKWADDTRNDFDVWFDSVKDTLQGDVAQNLLLMVKENEKRIDYLEHAVFDSLTANPFKITFENLDGITFKGIWNEAKRRVEV